MRSYHPYPPVAPSPMRYLVVGTFPPARLTEHRLAEGDVPFYYGSRENYFWPVIREITGLSLNSPEEMRTYLHDARIGMTDTIESCIRRNGSSADADLKDIAWRDNSMLMDACSRLLFTSMRSMRQAHAHHSIKVPWTVLPSPSGSAHRAICAREEYRQNKRRDGSLTPFTWRVKVYREWFLH